MKHSPLMLLTLFSLFAGLMAHSAVAGNGKISGRVTGADDAEPLPGTTIVIAGTRYGAAADAAGNYFILNVPPGIYDVMASALDRIRVVVKDVQVRSDRIVTVDFALEPSALGLEEMVVQAERPSIDHSQTSARTTFTSDDFVSLPLRTPHELLATSASSYKGFVRGGRQYQTKTIIDGVDVSDNFYAAAGDQTTTPYLVYNAIIRQAEAATSSRFDLNLSAIEEANVLTGGVGADYNSATAGLVTYSLRDGRGVWSGRFDFRRSQTRLNHLGARIYNDDTVYAKERAALLSSNPTKAGLYTYFPGKYSYGEKPTTDVEVGFGGSVDENGGLYATLGYHDSYGRLPNEFTRRVNSSVKVHYNVAEDVRVAATAVLDDRGRVLGWKNSNYSDVFRYFLEGVPKWDAVGVVGSMKVTAVATPTTFYEFQASLVRDVTRRGFSDNNKDGIIQLVEDGDFLTFADPEEVRRYMASASGSEFHKFFTPAPRNEAGSESLLGNQAGIAWKLGRPGIFYEKFINQTINLKGDITSQFTPNHLLSAGGQMQLHRLDRTLRAGYIGGVFPGIRNYVEEIWEIKPKEFSLYLQDRMEYAGLILNLGFRLDVLDLAASDYANYFAPFRDDTARGVGGSVTDIRRVPIRGPGISTKVFFSPRVGVSHPIGENAAMYFSFSRQQQSQPYSRLYSNYNDFGNPSLPVVTRTNQDPLKSTNYDLGIQWSFAEGYGLDVNAYYKDIQNYGNISFDILANRPWRSYRLSTNFGYADSRGIEITMRKIASPLADFVTVGGRISYAYSYIKQATYAGSVIPPFDSVTTGGRIPFEDIRDFNKIEQNVLGGNSTLTGGYDRTHRISFNLALLFPDDFSVSSIGTFSSGFFYVKTLGDPRARELGVGPWNKRVDLRLEKGFRPKNFGRIGLYLELMNAFNWTNILAYYVTSSDIGQRAWETHGDPTGGPTINRPVTQDGSMIFDIPREVYFGVNITF